MSAASGTRDMQPRPQAAVAKTRIQVLIGRFRGHSGHGHDLAPAGSVENDP